jgi:hypothetical protein
MKGERMHKLYELKEMLCAELEEYGSKDKLDVGGLDIVDKLAHAIKNIDRIIESYDGEYSGEGHRMGSYRRSYARRRDRMGRYSRDGYSMEFREDLESLMEDAPNEQIKRKIRELMQEV